MKKENERRLNFLIEEALKEDMNDSEDNVENNNVLFSESHKNK